MNRSYREQAYCLWLCVKWVYFRGKLHPQKKLLKYQRFNFKYLFYYLALTEHLTFFNVLARESNFTLSVKACSFNCKLNNALAVNL